MTAVSLINPYAPQPAQDAAPQSGLPSNQTMTPVPETATGNLAGNASDQSGQGAGSWTGTGGAQITALLKNGHDKIEVQRPSPESVVDAQSSTEPAAAYLQRQEQQQRTAKADAETRAADRAEEANAEAVAANLPEFVMPNPLPTAPILQRDDD